MSLSLSGFTLSTNNIHDLAHGESLSQKTIKLNEVIPVYVYLIYGQITAFFFLVGLALKESIKIAGSALEHQSFQPGNITSFTRIGRYCQLIFLVLCFSIVRTESNYFISVNLYFAPLAFMLVAFILAEIFREGNQLSEQDQLTI